MYYMYVYLTCINHITGTHTYACVENNIKNVFFGFVQSENSNFK